MAISSELVDILVCPRCKGELKLITDGSGLVCPACRLKYPIREDIPIMLIDEADRIGN
jgi:uncharacterized protein YbaR (Trm112 family)